MMKFISFFSSPRLSTKCCFSMLQLFQVTSVHTVTKKMWWVQSCVLFLPTCLTQWYTPNMRVINMPSHILSPIFQQKKYIYFLYLSFHSALACFFLRMIFLEVSYAKNMCWLFCYCQSPCSSEKDMCCSVASLPARSGEPVWAVTILLI